MQNISVRVILKEPVKIDFTLFDQGLVEFINREIVFSH